MTRIAAITPTDLPDWLRLRRALWPEGSADDHARELPAMLEAPRRFAQFLAREDGEAIGLAEASVRRDYVNGTTSSPVAFLEGIYVSPMHRRRGIARALVAAVQAWARERGCAELASDAPLANAASRAMHRALGFTETEAVVYFVKRSDA